MFHQNKLANTVKDTGSREERSSVTQWRRQEDIPRMFVKGSSNGTASLAWNQSGIREKGGDSQDREFLKKNEM